MSKMRQVKDDSGVNSIPLNAINPPKNPRRIVESNVDAIAESMRINGQLQPIALVPAKDPDKYDLRWGEHRRLAAIKLGWTHINAVVLRGWTHINAVVLRGESQDQLDLMTLDENIARSSGYSCVLEEAIMRMEQKKLYLRLHPGTGRGGIRHRGSNPNPKNSDLTPTFTVYASTRSNQSPDRIEQLVRIGTALSPYKHLLYGTPIDDNFTELLSLSRCGKAIPTIIEYINSGKFSRVDDAKKAIIDATGISGALEPSTQATEADQLQGGETPPMDRTNAIAASTLSNKRTGQNPNETGAANRRIDGPDPKMLQTSGDHEESSLGDRVNKIEELLLEMEEFPTYFAKKMKEHFKLIQEDNPPTTEEMWEFFLSVRELLSIKDQRFPIETFSCKKCGSKHQVAVQVKCTNCDEQAWVGKFPNHHVIVIKPKDGVEYAI